jgi:hypothetical protein
LPPLFFEPEADDEDDDRFRDDELDPLFDEPRLRDLDDFARAFGFALPGSPPFDLLRVDFDFDLDAVDRLRLRAGAG